MKNINKQNLIKILVSLVCVVVVIFIVMYLVNKHNSNAKVTESFIDESNTNDNYFSVDTINKITNSNLSIPKVKENTYKMMPSTILPYYGDFTAESVVDLINNNYFPCNNGDLVKENIGKTKKEIGFGSYTGVNKDNSSAFYTINKSLTEQITVPDLRRMYLAGAGNKIKTITDEIHSSLNSEELDAEGKEIPYVKGKIIGEELHKLSVAEMPSHNHGNSGNHIHNFAVTVESERGRNVKENTTANSGGYRGTATWKTKEDGTHTHDTNGEDKSHENRPPTVIVNYIMYVGELPNKPATTA